MAIRLVVCILGLLLCYASAQSLALVNVSVADLRSSPSASQPNFGIDYAQLTQLLYGEPVQVLQSQSGWSRIQAPLQRILVNGTWSPYEGYMQTSQLAPVKQFPQDANIVVRWNWVSVFQKPCTPMGCLPSDILTRVSIGTTFFTSWTQNGWLGVAVPPTASNPFQPRLGYIVSAAVNFIQPTFVPPLPSQPAVSLDYHDVRLGVTAIARQLLGWFYLWGGRSAFNDEMFESQTQITGVDCSGLVSISYKANGVLLPRDADPIFRASKNVTGGAQNMQPGDLFFSAHADKPNHMTHVMMLLDANTMIESAADPNYARDPTNGTRIAPIFQRFGASLSQLQWGKPMPSSGSILYWGTVLYM